MPDSPFPTRVDTAWRYTSPLVTAEDITASVKRSLLRSGSRADELRSFIRRALDAARRSVHHGGARPDLPAVDYILTNGNLLVRVECKTFMTARSLERSFEADRETVRLVVGRGKTDLTPLLPHLVPDLLSTVSTQTQMSLFRIAERTSLVEATPFHVLRQRDGEMPVLPLPEDEPGVDSQVVLTAPISPNAPNGCAGGSLEMDGYLAA